MTLPVVLAGVPLLHVEHGGGDQRTPAQKRPYDLKIVASTGRVARDGGIITADAWARDLSRFRANPVILWAHQHSTPPIAVAVEIESDEAKGRLTEWWRFLSGISDDPWDRFAGRIRALYAAGGMRAASVGFLVHEVRNPTDEEIKASRRDPQIPTWVATRAELLETSAVPVPADPEALAVKRALKMCRLKGSEVGLLERAWRDLSASPDLVPEELAATVDDRMERLTELGDEWGLNLEPEAPPVVAPATQPVAPQFAGLPSLTSAAVEVTPTDTIAWVSRETPPEPEPQPAPVAVPEQEPAPAVVAVVPDVHPVEAVGVARTSEPDPVLALPPDLIRRLVREEFSRFVERHFGLRAGT